MRLNAAVIMQGTTMSIDASQINEVVMTVKKGVFLAANNAATLNIDGVYVHASDTNTPNAFLSPTVTEGRPFVLAVADSKMNIDHSTFRYLGRDWNTSYGVSWSMGATGSITNSLLENNFIGVYTNASPGLKVLKNTLNYGADRIRYLSPVPAGSKLRGRVSIAEAEDVPPNGLRVHYRVVIEIEGGQRPACVAEVIGLHYS